MKTGFSSIDNLTNAQQKAVGFLAEFSKQMVVMAFENGRTFDQYKTVIQEIYRVTDETIDGCFRNGTESACQKGCAWCCSLNVKVTPLELISLADYFHSHLTQGERTEIQCRLTTNQSSCALLLNNVCLVYPVRPLDCRIYHSLNSNDCQKLHNEGVGEITARQDIANLGVGILAGLTVGLRRTGIYSHLLDLAPGLQILLEEPTSFTITEWQAGVPEFRAAEATNSQQIEEFHQHIVEEFGKLVF